MDLRGWDQKNMSDHGIEVFFHRDTDKNETWYSLSDRLVFPVTKEYHMFIKKSVESRYRMERCSVVYKGFLEI